MKERNEALSVALASYDESWLRVVANYLGEQSEIGNVTCYQKGAHLLSDLEHDCIPQIVVLDEQLSDMDVQTFLQECAVLPASNKPILLGLCSKRYLGYTGHLLSLGLADYLFKPLQLSSLVARMVQLQHSYAGGNVKALCDELYRQWGVEACDSTVYLTDAVRIANDAAEKLALRKEIVWQVAQLHGCSRTAIDSALRRLIDRLEKTATPAYLDFKQERHFGTQKPAVGNLIKAMIYQLAQVEKQAQEENENTKTTRKTTKV